MLRYIAASTVDRSDELSSGHAILRDAIRGGPANGCGGLVVRLDVAHQPAAQVGDRGEDTPRLRSALWRQWHTASASAALTGLGWSPALASHTGGSGRGPGSSPRSNALSVGLSIRTSARLAFSSLSEGGCAATRIAMYKPVRRRCGSHRRVTDALRRSRPVIRRGHPPGDDGSRGDRRSTSQKDFTHAWSGRILAIKRVKSEVSARRSPP